MAQAAGVVAKILCVGRECVQEMDLTIVTGVTDDGSQGVKPFLSL